MIVEGLSMPVALKEKLKPILAPKGQCKSPGRDLGIAESSDQQRLSSGSRNFPRLK